MLFFSAVTQIYYHRRSNLQRFVHTLTPTVDEIRFFLSQFRKGDINDPKYRQGLIDMLVNKIYLYDKKITVLCNTQDSHFDVDLDETSSSKDCLVKVARVELASESISTRLSPSAANVFLFRLCQRPLAGSVIGYPIGPPCY